MEIFSKYKKDFFLIHIIYLILYEMHYLYACSHYHKNKKVSLFTLVGEKKKDVKKTLLNAVLAQGSSMPLKEEDILSMYPCPFLRQIKKDKTN